MRRFSTAALLSDVKVLDLSRILAAPFATQMLGDMGATVYKVEHPRVGDDTREWGPPFTDAGHESAYFLSVNRNKHSLAIDLKHAKGVDVVRRLAARCDVVVENFPTGKLDALGLSYAELSRDNPGLVLASVTGFGSTGPYSDRLAYDVMVSGIGGLMGITGSPRGCMSTSVPVCVYADSSPSQSRPKWAWPFLTCAPACTRTARFSVRGAPRCHLRLTFACVAALLSRAKTGKGKRIEGAMQRRG